jgi:hypothetical protein
MTRFRIHARNAWWAANIWAVQNPLLLCLLIWAVVIFVIWL